MLLSSAEHSLPIELNHRTWLLGTDTYSGQRSSPILTSYGRLSKPRWALKHLNPEKYAHQNDPTNRSKTTWNL
ncbi:MAG TPA: hypothetical protein V6D19_02650 [Stenomitos sp.]